MARYEIIERGDGWYYASKMFLSKFKIGSLGYVNRTDSDSIAGCYRKLMKILEKQKSVHEVTIIDKK
jgi:hypothetical protein